ncbi:MAG: hypothetical protein EOR25_15590 [Mesorhizobium sp.]|uniref:hypothetical protein n=1 Tax=Mesorhizobium sp. TaxID=1871066 RepID=UPI000FE3F495|nr:hypothetical protein [Mesorhizobium sp.]RWH50267.1 MAG: hypothetical protein EOQ80_04665 [Mesorhizobium sp.]RWI47573.1 MAG: hypothetical protein EOR15_13920 [Mesorhizobium sp.]RWI88207.1 MAG: hypothetical protein EOR20_03975 [Mesorhizobium sp.]RWJ09653.1 MAG: hypothetical protein EOR24_18380 [Mesorhizobium sp.]RWJ16314.1 MAG: hypothetical protein EOR25_15590 [Mesorhizobium sp.]
MKFPLKPGYYWAKWRIAAEGTVEGDELTPSDFWEIAQVNENDPNWERNPAEDRALSVSLCGVSETQWRDCFVWGDFVAPLHNEPLPQPVPAVAVQIKRLEWREEPIPPAWECLASTGVGLYCIPLGRNLFELRFRDKDTLGVFDTLEAAKAAAQADHEARIRSAIDPVPAVAVVFASEEQISNLPPDPDDEGGAAYIPLRHTAAGKFQMPLYAAAAVPLKEKNI